MSCFLSAVASADQDLAVQKLAENLFLPKAIIDGHVKLTANSLTEILSTCLALSNPIVDLRQPTSYPLPQAISGHLSEWNISADALLNLLRLARCCIQMLADPDRAASSMEDLEASTGFDRERSSVCTISSWLSRDDYADLRSIFFSFIQHALSTDGNLVVSANN